MKLSLQQAQSLHTSIHQMEIALNGILVYLENIEVEDDEQQKKYWQKCVDEEIAGFLYNYGKLNKKIDLVREQQ